MRYKFIIDSTIKLALTICHFYLVGVLVWLLAWKSNVDRTS